MNEQKVFESWIYGATFERIFPEAANVLGCSPELYPDEPDGCFECILAVNGNPRAAREAAWAYVLKSLVAEGFDHRADPAELRKAFVAVKGGELATLLAIGNRRASLLDRVRNARVVIVDGIDRARIITHDQGVGFLEIVETVVDYERTIVLTIANPRHVEGLADLLDAVCPALKNGNSTPSFDAVADALQLMKGHVRRLSNLSTGVQNGGALE